MTKFDIQKLAPTLSGKERAKLIITSWHKAIVGKETFSQAEQSALLTFDGSQPGESRKYCYYMSLYKQGYFIYKDLIQEAYLRIVVLSTQLHQFHVAIGVDGAIKMSLGAIQGVPKFISESELKQIRDKELAETVEPIAYLANSETNAILKSKGFFEGKDMMAYYLDSWERTTTLVEFESEMDPEWLVVFWEQVEKIRTLIKDGKLEGTAVPDNQKNLCGIKITGVEDGVKTGSWLQYNDRYDKDWRAYSVADELYAVSYDPDEIEAYNPEKIPWKQKMRDGAVELCKKLEVVQRNFVDKTEQLTINEKSLLLHEPQKILRDLEEQIQILFTHKATVAKLEGELDDLPLFDEKTYEIMNEQFAQSTKAVQSHNEFMEGLERKDRRYFTTQLVDKEKYLIKTLPVLTEVVDKQAKEIIDLAEHETEVFYR